MSRTWRKRLIRLYASITVFSTASVAQKSFMLKLSAAKSYLSFHPCTGVNADALTQVQTTLRGRILRAFVGRGLLEGFDAKEMLAYRHSGFSVDTSVCIAAQDRAGLERLLRYCARPAFALDRLRRAGSVLVYRSAKQHSEPVSKPHNKRGAKVDELTRTPPELIERIAALVPLPRTHRHRYFGVLQAIRLNSPGPKWLLPRDAAARLDLWLSALNNALYYRCTGVLPP